MTLESDLKTIQHQAASVLRRERRQHAVRPAIEGALWLCAVTVVGYLVYLGLAHLAAAAGATAWPAVPVPVLIVIVVVPGLLYAVLRVIVAGAGPLSPDQVLAAADERHGTKDRLRTATDFLGRQSRTAFMQAAVLDATGVAARAREAGLPEQPAPTRFTSRGAAALLVAALLLVVGVLVPMPVTNAASAPNDDETKIAKLDPVPDAKKDQPNDRPVTPLEAEDAPVANPQTAPPRARGEGKKDADDGSEVKKTRGAMGSGQSADAASATGTSEARGAPSSQAQASRAGKKPTKKKKVEPKKRENPKSDPMPPKEPDEDSGATAGRGAASGSNKSPSASPWSSKDQVTSEDEEDHEDDEEVDDEFDNSDARGGVQPHLRDRRPPVNRDLGIGFGNQKNPDANGRGGPSEMKKSRGVASLVLGVPIPDHVKGRPNPGKTKITQERVEPKPEDAVATQATARPPREAPVGHLANPDLAPWMRDLIRNYFQTIRQRNTRRTDPRQPEPR